MFRIAVVALFACSLVWAQTFPAPTTIAVVDAESGQACAAAMVWVIGVDRPVHQVPSDPAETVREHFARVGTPLRCDERGEVHLPAVLRTGGIGTVGALAGDRWGQSTTPWPHRARLVVEVAADPVITLQVLGPDDRPSPVGACFAIQPGGREGSIGGLRLPNDAATGITRCRLSTLREPSDLVQDGRIDDEPLVQVTLDAITPAPITTLLDLGLPLPPRPTLRAPALGSLRVRVLDPAGRPVASGYAHAAAIDPATGHRIQHGVQRPIRAGEVYFDAVALGLQVQLQVSEDGGPPTFAAFPGPIEAGATVAQTVALTNERQDGKTPFDLHGRLLDAGGKPLVHRTVHFAIEGSGPGPRSGGAATTDADGLFKVQCLGPFADGSDITLAAAGRSSRLVDHFATRSLPPDRFGQALGDVRVAPAPLLVAGRVVDSRGQPVQAQVRVRRDGHPRDDDPSLPGTLGATDAAGHFALHASFRTGKQLHVTCTPLLRWEVLEQTAAPGSSDLVFTVAARTAISGRLRLADARQSRHLTIMLQPSAGAHDDWQQRPAATPVAADGTFSSWPVVAGTYRLSVRLANAIELVRLDDVVVSAEGAVDDSRLAAIDLTTALREVTVTVVRGDRALDLTEELSFAPVLDAPSELLRQLPVVAAMRTRAIRVWLPPGPFQVQARVRNARTPAEAVRSAPVDVRDDRAIVVLTQ